MSPRGIDPGCWNRHQLRLTRRQVPTTSGVQVPLYVACESVVVVSRAYFAGDGVVEGAVEEEVGVCGGDYEIEGSGRGVLGEGGGVD